MPAFSTRPAAAGLRLAALSLAGHPDPERFAAEFSAIERTVAEYLLEMFAGLLRLELRRAAPGEVAPLHGAGAAWFAGHGYPVEAIRHAQATADWELAAGLLAGHWPTLYLGGQAAAHHPRPVESVRILTELLRYRCADGGYGPPRPAAPTRR